ncbi:hypothetical protein ACHAXA_000354 [Cyclostephanos tholiformis]|uniref:HSF-type DNA-binding domain-containing protein n=1 Tax=Cyclostephanos tholiformis TaxID=382380 RepID=A0ABD3RK69_9STRA
MCGTFHPRIIWTQQSAAPSRLYSHQDEWQEGRGVHPLSPSCAAAKFECGRNNVIDSWHDASEADAREDLSREFLAASPLDVDGLEYGPRSSGSDAITCIRSMSTTSFSSNSSSTSSPAVSVVTTSDARSLPCLPSSHTIASASKRRRKRGPQRPGKTAKQKERLFVKHDYHDLATNISFPNVPLQSQSFLVKLHRILEESEAAGLGHIISWQPHGRAFKIHNPTLFAEQIMRNYFPKMTKVASFQRQFNLYGFEKLSRAGPDAGGYYHEAFLRYFPGLSLQRMSRRRVKGTGYKAASNPEMEPDLYAFPSMDELMKKKAVGAVGASSLQSSTHLFRSHAGFPTRPHNSTDEETRNEDATTNLAMMPSYLHEVSTSLHQETAQSPGEIIPMRYQQYPPLMADPTVGTNDHFEYHPPSNDSMIDVSSSVSEDSQDWLSKDFFANYDVTPLLAVTDSRQQEQPQANHPILLEFAKLWEGGAFLCNHPHETRKSVV